MLEGVEPVVRLEKETADRSADLFATGSSTANERRAEMKEHMLRSLVVLGLVFLFPATASHGQIEQDESGCIHINSKRSLVHLGSIDSFDITEGGKRAAKRLLASLEDNDPDFARAALKIYKDIIPKENYGSEYTALEWFCEYLLASEEDKKEFFKGRYDEDFFKFFARDDFATLKEYLKRKYKLERVKSANPKEAHEREAFLEDFILFNNPKREQWEKTSKIIEVLNLKAGDKIADIGSGPGYYSLKFAEIVGEEGRVYAIDTNKRHAEYLSSVVDKHGIENIEIVRSRVNSISLVNKKVDVAFMCSLYHIIYTASMEEVRDQFLNSIREALKKDGTLVIVDNALVEDTELPYHGPYMAKELIIAQLKHYGFHLVDYHQPIPQRYVLTFKMD